MQSLPPKGAATALLEASVPLDSSWPSISVIVPTLNSAENIDITLDSILQQQYPFLEIIVIDGGSEDRTLEFVKSKHSSIKIHSVPLLHLYDRLNRASTLATGNYLNFLLPGDSYLHPLVLKKMMLLARDHRKNDFPSLLYCGSVLREAYREVKIANYPLKEKLLKYGIEPSCLQALWVRRDLFRQMGQLSSRLRFRGGLELLARLSQQSSFHSVRSSYILIDHASCSLNMKESILYFLETVWVLKRFFGFFAACRYLFWQKDLKKAFSLFLNRIKRLFHFGRPF